MTKPLEGILVVAVEQALAAPLCSGRLAEAGARVIKIERDGGDFARGYDSAVQGEASYFVWTNHGKESLQLDIKDPEDAALLHRIIAQADVLIQNLAPGAMARAGFGSDELRQRHPRLITCDISGYAESGPYRDMKAYDLLVQAESGLLAVSGTPEGYGRIGASICDIGAGLNALVGIQQALLERHQTGRGSGVKVSLFDSTADFMTVPLLHNDYAGKAPKRVGLKHPSIAPYGGFDTRDGETLVVAVQNNRDWERFSLGVLQRPDLFEDPRYTSNEGRVLHREELEGIINQTFALQPRAALEQRLREAGVAYGAVNSVESFSQHPQLRRRDVTLPSGETVQIVAPPVRFVNETLEARPVPALGEHSNSIRSEFA